MIKLDELKTQVQVHESMQAEYPDLPDHFFEAGVSPKVLGILIETAESAFEMPIPEYRWNAAHWSEVYLPLLNRIQDLKRELEQCQSC